MTKKELKNAVDQLLDDGYILEDVRLFALLLGDAPTIIKSAKIDHKDICDIWWSLGTKEYTEKYN